MAATMNVSLPDALRLFVETQVVERGYASSSEYIRELVRRDQSRQELRSLVLEGARSPLAGPADEAYFDALRARVGARAPR